MFILFLYLFLSPTAEQHEAKRLEEELCHLSSSDKKKKSTKCCVCLFHLVMFILRGMILKFWSWCYISVTFDATCLKIVQHNNILFIYTLFWHVWYKLMERPKIYTKTNMPSMQWAIKQTVHVRDATILTSAVSAFRFYGCLMIIRKPICSEDMANFLYDLDFLGPWMYGFATVSYNQISDHLKFWPILTAVTTAVLKVKMF